MNSITPNPGALLRASSFCKALLLFALLLSLLNLRAQAGSATWNLDPANGDWFTATNWTPATVPNGETDTATFNLSNLTAVISRADTRLAGVVFEPGASAYSITIRREFTFAGAGVLNNSGSAQTFLVPIDAGLLRFRNSAAAGAAIFSAQGGDIYFYDSSSAGDATFRMEGLLTDSVVEFYDSSTAGNASFSNRAGDGVGGATNFYDSANAGTGTFSCEGGSTGEAYWASISFNGSSSAADGTFMAEPGRADGYVGGSVDFNDSSTANNAALIAIGANVNGAYGGLVFFGGDRCTASAATLIAYGGKNGGLGGTIDFAGNSHGGAARVQLAGDAQLDLSSHNAPGLTIGSLEGEGTVMLGGNNLTVGRNDSDTTFFGVIEDGPASGGSLTKTGSGTLSLARPNTYTGGTVIEDGFLLVSNRSGSGTGAGAIQVNDGVLGGQGTVAGPVTIGTGIGRDPYLEPGPRFVPGILTIQRALTFASDGEYQWQLSSDAAVGDELVSRGVTINDGAEIHVSDFGSTALPAGTVFTVISNTAATPISGAFDELADGSTVTIGSNTFQANYEGGDGDDLTLTVVP